LNIGIETTESSEKPLIIDGVNVSEYNTDDLLGADEVEEMIDDA